MTSMLFDGHALRDMWRSDNAKSVLKDALLKDDIRWLRCDTILAYNDEDLKDYLKSLKRSAQSETEAHHECLADLMDEFSLDDDDIDSNEGDYVAVATGVHCGQLIITSSETAGGLKRKEIAQTIGADVVCWKDHFDI